MTYFRSQCVEAGGSGGLRTEVVGQLRGVVRFDVSAGRASMQEGAPIVSRAYELDGGGARMDPARNRFPFCLVWGPLPIISSVLYRDHAAPVVVFTSSPQVDSSVHWAPGNYGTFS